MGQTLTNKRKTKVERSQELESREEYFISNGGILLEKYIALSQGRDIGVGQLKIFSIEDITKATCNYDPDVVVGRSNLRNVYKATIDGNIVAVRVPPQVESKAYLIDHHLTEASMAMVMNHVNIEKIIGCCLETLVPILVNEFTPNRSLFQHLHDDNASSKHIQWVDRLKIANDIAYALSYMHNALSKPVVHRYLDSHIVLLDYSFHAKLSNFGYSVSITPGETPQKWPIAGAPGYIDPEYIVTQEVTAKCDVYSFGVLMLELLTRGQPNIMARYGNNLVDDFMSAMEKNCMMEMIDSEVLEQATRNEICQVAQLALTCLADKGIERPTMIEVCMQLRQIRC